MQEKLLGMLMQKDEITWQSIILDLVKSGEMDPWDVDVSILTFKYLEAIKAMKEANLFVSAKVLLASAMLLKIKSEKLLSEGLVSLDNYLFPPEELEDLDFVGDGKKRIKLNVEPKLTIKTPQARKRKVTLNDLIGALEKALEVQERRVIRRAKKEEVPDDLIVPEKSADITTLIGNLHQRIRKWFVKKPKLVFSDLVPGYGKKDKLYTFIPLLHLSNQQEVDLDQPEHFGEINISLLTKDLNTGKD